MASSTLLPCLCTAAILACATTSSLAQTYPQKPIRLVVPFVPGGTVDTTARIITARMAEGLGQPLVIDYRSGANGIVGADHVAKSAPDGYTLLAAPSGQAINHLLNSNVTYDPAKDFAPVILIGTVTMVVVVHPSMPTTSVKALIALAKAQPGALTYGSGGAGSSSHLAVELFSTLAGAKLTHVPYKGDAPRVTDLLGGHIALLFLNSPAALPLVKAKRIRALAVTSAKRAEQMPDVPALAETMPGYEAGSWQGWFAPVGMPPAIIERLNAEANRVLRMPEVRERLSGLGMNVIGGTPEAFMAFFKADIAKWADVIKRSNVKL
jgi:tripartite-type tricarboxylate transporter receptor subunit TctC